MKEETTARTPTAKIFEWRLGFDAIFLVDLGIRLGLFRAFAETPGARPAEIAAALDLHPPYVEIWCVTAYALGLLEPDSESTFRLAPSWKSILTDPSQARYLGSLVRLLAEFTTDDFRRSLEAFRSGETVPFQGRDDIFALGEERYWCLRSGKTRAFGVGDTAVIFACVLVCSLEINDWVKVKLISR